MEFQFNVNEYFKRPIVEIGNTLLPPDFVGDRRALWNTVNKVAEIVNEMGEASAHAQGLNKPITTAERLRQSDQNLYLLVDHDANNGNGAVTGMLKIGRKGLYVFDREGQHYQVSPPCVLDFYVHEKRQRSGLGKKLFEYMLEKENVKPHNLAIDRPSEKFLNFLNKHYYLQNPIKQMNNYVVFDGFFPESQKKEIAECSPMSRTNGLQSTQSPNNQPLYGRYGAPRPPCSMGQIIHNTTAQKNSEPTSPNSFKNSHEIRQMQIPSQQEHRIDQKPEQHNGATYEQRTNVTNENKGHNLEDSKQEDSQYSNQEGKNNPKQYDFQNPIRMFPERETHSGNAIYAGKGLLQSGQNVGDVWPGHNNPQQVYQMTRMVPNPPHEQWNNQMFQNPPLNYQPQQHNPPTVIPQDVSMNRTNIQQFIPNHQHQQQSEMARPIDPQNNQMSYIPQQHSTQQPQPIHSYNPTISYNPIQGVSHHHEIRETQAPTVFYNKEFHQNPSSCPQYGHQVEKLTYSAPQQQIMVHPQQCQQNVQGRYTTTNEVAHQNMVAQQNPQTSQYPSRSNESYTIQEQNPRYTIGNQQHGEYQKSISNIPLHQANQQSALRPAYSSREILDQQRPFKTEKHEYQLIPQSPQKQQNQPSQIRPVQINETKSQLKSETVHSLLQVDPKFFKPDPIQLKQPYNAQPQCPTLPTRKDDTVASLLNAEQEFFENGLLREKYRVPSRPTYTNHLSSLHEEEGYPKQVQVARENRHVYPQTQLSTQRLYQPLYTNPIAQTTQQQNSFQENDRAQQHSGYSDNFVNQTNAHQSEHMTNHSERMPHQNEHMPHHSELMPRQNEHIPHPSEYIPHQNERMPDQNENIPHPSEYIPHQNDRMPHHNVNIPHPSEYIPYKNERMPQQNEHIPHASEYIPHQNEHMSHQSNHIPQQQLVPGNLLPKEQKSNQPFQSHISDQNKFNQQYNTMNPPCPQPQSYIGDTNNLQYREQQTTPINQYDTQHQPNSYHQQPFTPTQQFPPSHITSERPMEKQSRETEDHTDIRDKEAQSTTQYRAGIASEQIKSEQEVSQASQSDSADKKSSSEKPNEAMEIKVYPENSPATVRQGSYIANDFITHSEGPNRSSTQLKSKLSDEERVTRKKDISRQYGLNEVDMRGKSYKSAIIKRPTNHQEFDTLEFGYPPQVSKNVTMSSVVADSVHSSPKLERPKSLEIQTDISVQEPQVPPEMKIVEDDDCKQEPDIKPELEKLTMNDASGEPPENIDKENGSKTPRHLTDQGYFDLKFYHNKLW